MAFTVLLSLTLQRAVSAEALHPDSLTAKEIIKRLAEEYAKSKSYSDSGVVKTVFIRNINNLHSDCYDHFLKI
jgi:hypothetical protein